MIKEKNRRRERQRRISKYARRTREKSLSEADKVRISIEKEREERNIYFSQALQNLDTKSFMKEWSANSKETRNEILDFVAQSFGTIDGFDLANRALQGPLKMENAEIDTEMVIEMASRVSKLVFFEFILKKSKLSPEWQALAMNLYINREINPPAKSEQRPQPTNVAEQLKNILRSMPVSKNDPFPVAKPKPERKPNRKPYLPENRPIVTQKD